MLELSVRCCPYSTITNIVELVLIGVPGRCLPVGEPYGTRGVIDKTSFLTNHVHTRTGYTIAP